MSGRGLLAALAVLLAAAPAGGDEALASRRERLAREIARLQQERDRLAERERGVLDRVDRLAADARLIDAKLERLTLERGEVERERAALTRRRKETAASLEQSRERLRSVVVLLQRIGPLGRLRPLLDAPDASRLAASVRLAHELSSFRREQTERIRSALEELDRLEKEIDARAARLAELEQGARTARAELARTIAARRRLLEEIASRREIREQAIAELERAREELARRIEAGSSGPPLELDVTRFRGLLPMPLAGEVIRGFGEQRDRKLGTVLPHPGWDIDAPFGAEVHAPFGGRVAWTGWLRGYGLVVVVDHGHGVHTVVAHLSAVLASVGERVEAGQVLGLVGDTGSLSGPHLYLEVRERGRAVDPALWIDRTRAF